MLSTKKGYTLAKVVGNRKYKRIGIQDPYMFRMIQDDQNDLAEIEDEERKTKKLNKIGKSEVRELAKLAAEEDEESYTDSESEEKDEDDLPKLSISDIFTEDEIIKAIGTRCYGKRTIPQFMLDKLEERKGYEFHIKTGYLQPVPIKEKMRGIHYVSGPEGSGKSYYVAQMLKEYSKIYPKNEIYVFSNLTDDPAYEGIKRLTRIEVTETLIKDPIDLKEDLTDTCVVFDDYEQLRNKKLKAYVTEYLIPTIIKQGRKLRITIFMISHMISNYKETRDILAMADTITIFPLCGSQYHVNQLLTKRLFLDKKTVKRICSLPSRWVTLSLKAPNYCIYQQGAFIL